MLSCPEDPVGAVEVTDQSLPWGDGLVKTATVGSALAAQQNFATLDQDSETLTEHASFRQYAHSQGHWLSPDPYLGSYDLTNPQTFNRYSYALNNPVSYVDRSGLILCDYGSSDQGGEDIEDDMEGAQDCTDGGGTVVNDFQSFAVNGNGTNGDYLSLLQYVGTSTLIQYIPASAPNNGCSSKPGILPSTIGLVGGGEASAGVAATGASAQSSQGVFGTLNGGTAWVSSSTAVANYGSNVASGVSQVDTPITFGGYAGVGVGLVFSNATNLQQLSGPFETYTLSIPAASFSFSHGGGIWEFQVSL